MKIIMKRFGITIKKKNWFFRILKIIVLICVLSYCIYKVTFGVQNYIQSSINKLSVTDDLNATWIGSLASYWGGILGGIISGTLTIIGVAWTIKYYRDSDAVKSRLEYMPFLMLETDRFTKRKEDIIKEDIIKDINIYEIYSSELKFKIEKNKKTITKNKEKIKEKIFYCKINIKNIGNGFAKTLVINTGENIGGIAYDELIQVNDTNEFYLKIHLVTDVIYDEINFAIRYIDCMTNEYMQYYKIEWSCNKFDKIKINNGYPSFICQTHEIGKK